MCNQGTRWVYTHFTAEYSKHHVEKNWIASIL